MRPVTLLRTLPVFLLGLAALAGCADANPEVLRVLGNIVVEREGEGVDMCFPEQAEIYRGGGVLDLSLANHYVYYGHVENLLPETKTASGNGPAELRADSAAITLEKFAISMDVTRKNTPFQAPTPKLSWEVPTNLTIKPNGAGIIVFDAVPPEIGSDWRIRFGGDKGPFGGLDKYRFSQRVTLRISAWGTMADGEVVHSDETIFPITLCWGCLLYLPTFSTAPGIEAKDQWKQCSNMTVTQEYIVPCAPGQDNFVECGLGCQICKIGESMGAATKCDAKFCPALE